MTRVGLVGLCVCWTAALVSLDGQGWPAQVRRAALPWGEGAGGPGPRDGTPPQPPLVPLLALRCSAGVASDDATRALADYLQHACPAFRDVGVQPTAAVAR